MFGNIIQGSYVPGDTSLGVYVTEVTSNISQSTSRVILRGHAVFSSYHTTLRIPSLDIIVDASYPNERYIPKIGIGAYGNFDEFGTTLLSRLGFHSYSTFIAPSILASGPNRLGFRTSFDFSLEHPDENSIAWSNIGELDFTIGRDNVAGKMPIDWKGYIYAIEQLAQTNIIYVYGQNGITQVSPSGKFYGRKLVSNLGIKGKQAVVNTKDAHYFISTNNNLYRIDGSNIITKLGYSEFMALLTDPVMSYDNYNKYIYICDGTTGFIYSIESEGLTTGPSNVTSIYYRDNFLYVGSPGTISIPDLLLVTDIYDMGTKKEKTIFEIMLGVNDVTGLELSIDYRISPNDLFSTIPYKPVGPNGIVKIPCYGREFKFRLRGTDISDNFKLESITISGVIHGFSFLDTITIK